MGHAKTAGHRRDDVDEKPIKPTEELNPRQLMSCGHGYSPAEHIVHLSDREKRELGL